MYRADKRAQIYRIHKLLLYMHIYANSTRFFVLFYFFLYEYRIYIEELCIEAALKRCVQMVLECIKSGNRTRA